MLVGQGYDWKWVRDWKVANVDSFGEYEKL